MQQDRELRDLARAIAALRKRGDARYPAKLRVRITAWVIARRERGDWWTDISTALGVPAQTLVRWSDAGRVAPAGEMKAVDVIGAPSVGTVTIVAPTGLRIEGVSIDAGDRDSARPRVILGTSRVVRVFAYPAPVDLRKGYDGLYGLVQIDNNATERGIRGPVVGRRNHFGSKSRRGAEVAATLYTLVETAKLHDIDPAAYLHAAIVAADRGELLLPTQFAASAGPAL